VPKGSSIALHAVDSSNRRSISDQADGSNKHFFSSGKSGFSFFKNELKNLTQVPDWLIRTTGPDLMIANQSRFAIPPLSYAQELAEYSPAPSGAPASGLGEIAASHNCQEREESEREGRRESAAGDGAGEDGEAGGVGEAG
jgi:hypothetical protein